MMFYLRGLLVAISMFVLTYVACSAMVCAVWRQIHERIRGWKPAAVANTLYAIRISPVAFALLAVFGLSVPSFLRFEPHANGEAVGVIPIVLAAVFVGFTLVNGWRAWDAFARTRGAVRDWTRGAELLAGHVAVACFQANKDDAPPLALAGVGSPSLLISSMASAVLTPPELARAVEHELAHWRARDNFKKLILQVCAFPGMTSLERAWLAAVEFSADSASVHDQAEALDLASALVKISRLGGLRTLPALTSGIADCPGSLLQARVQRLLEWKATPASGLSSRKRSDIMAMVLAVSAALMFLYPALLRVAHVATEFLVR